MHEADAVFPRVVRHLHGDAERHGTRGGLDLHQGIATERPRVSGVRLAHGAGPGGEQGQPGQGGAAQVGHSDPAARVARGCPWM